MKIIVSHDVDHLNVSEHLLRDAIIPKQIIRKHIELFGGKISLKEYALRWRELIEGKMQNIKELHAFNKANGIPATWFFGTANGTGLSYPHEHINPFVEFLMKEGAGVELHGIRHDDKTSMLAEKKRLEEKKKMPVNGIRMHYLKKNEHTLNLLAECGYRFDSSVYEFRSPYKVGKMWEFPVHMMDGYVIEKPRPWQSKNLRQCMEITKARIEKGVKENISFFVIDFHDRYFSPKFQTWMEWYMQTVEYLKTSGFEFTDYISAMEELEKQAPIIVEK
ncbi:MAG: hypothetical protein N3F09_03895 [Bacteroidia bacterium]|nr:hypothetical protein [Bacteroidia bacterium]